MATTYHTTTGNETTTPGTQKRLDVLDILRGFALFGILMVNITFFANPIYELGITPATHTLADRFVTWLIAFGFESKFYVLFSFLFGYGLAIQLVSAATRGEALGPRYGRRLIGLLFFGILHGVFFFVGDILVSYVLLGIVLWLVRDWEPRRLMWMACTLIGAAVLGRMVFLMAEFSLASPEAMNQTMQMAEQARQNYLGSFAQATGQRIQDLGLFYVFALLAQWPTALAMFALGLAAGKIGFFKDLAQHLPTMRRWLPWTLALGIIGNGAYASLINSQEYLLPATALVALEAVAAPALTFSYIFAIVWIVQHPRFGSWLNPLRAAGRMSLTNYLSQAIICSFLFNGWGLGWYGSVGPFVCFLIVVTIFAVQVWLSNWWMRHFRYGPAEWLLRSWTYLQWPPVQAKKIEA